MQYLSAILILTYYLSGNIILAQTAEADSISNKNGLYPIPVVFYLPSSGYAFGAAFLYYNYAEQGNLKRWPDILAGFGTYSTKGQIQASVRTNRYWGNNDYRLDGEISYFYSPDEFWGIGPDPNVKIKEEVTYKQYRIKLDFLKRLNEGLYIGPYYWFEKFSLAEYDKNGLIASGNLAGALGVTTSGLGFEVVWDKRDSLFYTTNGLYVDVKSIFYQKIFFGDVNFLRVDLDARYFIPMASGKVLAFNSIINSTAGDVPIQMLPKLGNQQIMRGYPMGKYTDKNLWAFQAEFRSPLFWRIGGTVFIGVGQVFPEFQKFTFRDLKIAGGIGLRYTLDQQQHLNARVDVAQSEEGTLIYFTIQEAF